MTGFTTGKHANECVFPPACHDQEGETVMERWLLLGVALSVLGSVRGESAQACWYYGSYLGGYVLVPPKPVVMGYNSSGVGGCQPIAVPAVIWVMPVMPMPPARPPRVEAIPSGHSEGKGESSRSDPEATWDGSAPAKANVSEKDMRIPAPGVPMKNPPAHEVSGKPSASQTTPVSPPLPSVQPAAGQGAALPPFAPADQEKLPPLKLPSTPSGPKRNSETPDRVPPPVAPLPPSSPPPPAPRNNGETLPPLTLPPEIPPVRPPTSTGTEGSTSRYRPERQAPTAVFPAVTNGPSVSSAAANGPLVRFQVWSGPPATEGYRLLRFLNYTDRAVVLKVEGERVTVPARSQLPVWVGPVVRWQLADGEVHQWAFRADVGGVDIVFAPGSVRSTEKP